MVLQSFQAACEMFPLHVLEAKAGICDVVSNFYAIANLLFRLKVTMSAELWLMHASIIWIECNLFNIKCSLSHLALQFIVWILATTEILHMMPLSTELLQSNKFSGVQS